MQYFRKFLSFLSSRQTLALIGIALLAAAIWWVGPMLALHGLQPLASESARIATILWLVALTVVWLVSWPFSLVGVASACLLIWHVGPMFSIGSEQPLAPTWVRVLIICALVAAYAAYWLRKAWIILRDSDDPVAKLLSVRMKVSGRQPASEELKSVASSVQQAIAQLKGMRTRGGFRRRLLEGKRYLYDVPWYMIIGSPGAGKTTAVLNSGLRFPQVGKAAGGVALGAEGGTMHCDWWLSNEAVLIDTAGRYTDHDSDAAKDPAEWHGFLGLLRKHRPRAPINGALVALNAADLLTMSTAERDARARVVRERLLELRRELGIAFPVYVLVTKMDLLRGFGEYFQSLTAGGRTQPWGFTFSASQPADRRETFAAQVASELDLLKERLSAGLRGRMNEELDVSTRRCLFALPQEFAGLSLPLAQALEEIFIDSRFDTTQRDTALRGVYFTSGAQSHEELPADKDTLLQRLKRNLRSALPVERAPAGALLAVVSSSDLVPRASVPTDEPRPIGTGPAPVKSAMDTVPPVGYQGYFIKDVLTKVVFPEAYLVQPNSRWENRFKILRLGGHALALAAFLWFVGGLAMSFRANQRYLTDTSERTEALNRGVRSLSSNYNPQSVPEVLGNARNLASGPVLDPDPPAPNMGYGLSVVAPVEQVATRTYSQLQSSLLLPSILSRMESVLAESVRKGDAVTAYETLRVYKLLHDGTRYMMKGGALEVRDWVVKDWENTDSVAVFRGRTSMIDHVKSLFDGAKPVRSAALPNEALVREVQAFLGASSQPRRIYERAKVAMQSKAPPDFTLARALGPPAAALFVSAANVPNSQSVPGIFTYDGYRQSLDKRLSEFVDDALEDDAWVMDRSPTAADARAQVGLPGDEAAVRKDSVDKSMLREIRRLYLTEYAAHWEAFASSIRAVGGNDDAAGQATSAGNLGLQLNVLRQFAAPESPLLRLARAISRETTLSRPLTLNGQPLDPDRLDKAAGRIDTRAALLSQSLSQGGAKTLEREIVDDRFIALREVVGGQPDPGAGGAGVGARPSLGEVSAAINEYYNSLVITEAALAGGNPPPDSTDAGVRLKLEASKLPSPLRDVLTGLASSGSANVLRGSTDIMRKQAQAQLDLINGAFALQVVQPCDRGIEGRYPLAAGANDASMQDFSQFFGPGGAVDNFFTKNLAPLVDTSVKPWRYKDPSMAHALGGVDALVQAASTTPTGVTAMPGPSVVGELLALLPTRGPKLDLFYRAQQIRAMFFSDGSKTLGWKANIRVAELDPSITDLNIDIDGQGQRYAHGPVEPLSVSWPGPRGGTGAELAVNPRVSARTSSVVANGPWALFHLIDKGRFAGSASPGRVNVEYDFDGRKALLAIDGGEASLANSQVLRGFSCPAPAA